MTKPNITPEAVERLVKDIAPTLCTPIQSVAATTLRAQAERIKELEAEVDEEISNRDGFERAFSAAYEAATGREMVWSSDFGIAEALQEIREASVGTRNEALREAADVCDFVDQDDSLILPHSAYVLALIKGDTND